jgi:hypothetical protein
MKTARLVTAMMVAAASAAGCATRPATPPETTSTFMIEEDLVGASIARGEFRTITGVRRGFTARLNGSWDGRTLTLVEDFEFDDGERDRKTWRLERIAPGRYVGTREDVIGQAIGYQDGPVFRLEYDMLTPSEYGRGRKLRFRDVMAERADGVILNNATVGWRGFRVGSVSLVIERHMVPAQRPEPALALQN